MVLSCTFISSIFIKVLKPYIVLFSKGFLVLPQITYTDSVADIGSNGTWLHFHSSIFIKVLKLYILFSKGFLLLSPQITDTYSVAVSNSGYFLHTLVTYFSQNGFFFRRRLLIPIVLLLAVVVGYVSYIYWPSEDSSTMSASLKSAVLDDRLPPSLDQFTCNLHKVGGDRRN